jgi:glycosyltransferase involved in cell wall biosynthesis
MRILRIIARLNIGGPARHVTILNTGLAARGHDTLLAFGSVGDGEGSLEDLADRLPACRIPELGRRIRPLDDLVAFYTIVRLMFRFRPDVVHTHTAKAGMLGRMAAAVYNATGLGRRRTLVVHTFHGHVLEGYFGALGSRLVRLAERALAVVTDMIVAVSDRQRAELSGRFHVADASRIVVVPLGLDLEHLLALPADAPSLRDTLAISPGGFVGRLVEIKAPFLLWSAFQSVVARHPTAVLLIAGEGPLEAQLRREVAARGLEPNVRFCGWQRDLPLLYASCDIVALTSRNEGTPVALIEAMAAGRPVIATAVGGVPDIVATGRSGILVNRADVDEMAAGLMRLVADPMLRETLGRAARRDAASRFRSERLIDDVERLYQGLLESSKR